MNKLENLLNLISDNLFTYNYHSKDNSILEYFTSEEKYTLNDYLEIHKVNIVGVNFNVPFHYSTKQIGIMFENKEFKKRWIHCPLVLYEHFIIEQFGEKAYKFLDKCKERGYEV